MTPTSDQAHGSNGCVNSPEAARREERFSEVAAKLRTVFTLLSEIETNYPELWDFVRKIVQDELDPRNQIPEGMDLETWAKQQGAQPLDAFLHEFEQIP
jgi:hypothetical protein